MRIGLLDRHTGRPQKPRSSPTGAFLRLPHDGLVHDRLVHDRLVHDRLVHDRLVHGAARSLK
jgi:hypothetical protein